VEEKNVSFDIFISYRRDGGEILGRLIFELLKEKYKVFFDHESLSSGRFDTKLLRIIEEATDVIVLLTKGCLERCKNPDDWFRREIVHAQETDKNIILLMTEDFVLPKGEALDALPAEIGTLLKYNGYVLSVAYIDSVLAKLTGDMRTKPRSTSMLESLGAWRAFSQSLTEKRYTDSLPESVGRDILTGAITAFTEEHSGKILLSMLDRIEKNKSIRSKYRYEIDIGGEFDFPFDGVAEDKYYKLTESFSYSKTFLADKPSGEFWIGFITSLDELDTALKSASFFFSENLLIDRAEMERLAALDEEEKKRFYLSSMRAKLNLNGSVLTPDTVLIKESGIFAKYLPSDELLSPDTLDAKIYFRIPQRNESGYFFASINDPTYSPFISFTYPEDEFDVQMIPFLNRSVTSKDTKIFDGLRELSVEKEWVMPVSGAVFLIAKEK